MIMCAGGPNGKKCHKRISSGSIGQVGQSLPSIKASTVENMTWSMTPNGKYDVNGAEQSVPGKGGSGMGIGISGVVSSPIVNEIEQPFNS